MKKLFCILLFVVVILSHSVLYAINGKDWRKYNDIQKAMFLKGYIEHVWESAYDIKDGLIIRPLDEYSLKHHPEMIYISLLKNYDLNDIIELLDQFYNEPDNRSISFAEGFRLAVNGKSLIENHENEYEEQLNKARKFYYNK